VNCGPVSARKDARLIARIATRDTLLNTYITTYVRLTPTEQSALLATMPVTKLLDGEPDKEVSVFGAVLRNRRQPG
jgi:hypothetical protein